MQLRPIEIIHTPLSCPPGHLVTRLTSMLFGNVVYLTTGIRAPSILYNKVHLYREKLKFYGGWRSETRLLACLLLASQLAPFIHALILSIHATATESAA